MTNIIVKVIRNDVQRALKTLKKKRQDQGVVRDLKRIEFAAKPSERRRIKRARALRRQRRMAG